MKIILEFHGFRGSIKAAAEKHVKYFAELADLERLAEVKSLEDISKISHTDKNIRTAVDAMFRRSISLRASDIHVEPKRGKSLLRMRIDGTLHDIDWVPGALHGAFTSRIKAMSHLDIAEKRRPQDGRIKLTMDKREIEIRVSTVPPCIWRENSLPNSRSGSVIHGSRRIGIQSVRSHYVSKFHLQTLWN